MANNIIFCDDRECKDNLAGFCDRDVLVLQNQGGDIICVSRKVKS